MHSSKYTTLKFAFENKLTLTLMFIFSIFATLCLFIQPFLLVLIFNLLKTHFIGEISSVKDASFSIFSTFNLNNMFVAFKEFFSNFINNFDLKMKIFIYTIIFILISFFYLFFFYLSGIFKVYRETYLAFKVRKLLQSKILRYDLLDFYKNDKGYFQSIFIKDVNDFSILPGKYINGILTHSLQVFICIIFLISTNIKLTIVVFLIFFFHFFYNKLLSYPITKASKDRYVLSGKVSGMLIDYLNNYRVYKLSSEQKNKVLLNTSFEKLRKKEFKIELLDELQNPARFFINNIAIIATIGIVSYFLIINSINIETAFLYIFFCRYATSPISGLTTTILWGKVISTAFYRMQKIFDYEPKIIDGNISKNNFDNEIEFKNIFFSYGKKKIFENLSFKIKKNKHNLIVGDNGSGKSTLLDLLTRLVVPNQGKILIDQVDIKDLNLDEYHKIFSYISQNSTLMNSSIEENITFGTNLNKTDTNYEKKIRDTLTIIDGLFVYDLQNGIQSQVGESGIFLSGGQIQKILIANALLKNSQIIIFDKSFSALDKNSKFNFKNVINNLTFYTTIIEVNHDYDFFENNQINLINL